jgi:hypothetical protein
MIVNITKSKYVIVVIAQVLAQFDLAKLPESFVPQLVYVPPFLWM